MERPWPAIFTPVGKWLCQHSAPKAQPATVKAFDVRQAEGGSLLVAFFSEKLRRSCEQGGLTWYEHKGSWWAPPYLVAGAICKAYHSRGKLPWEEVQTLNAIRSELMEWEWRDIFHHGHLNRHKFAFAFQVPNKDHRIYLLKVLEVLRWSTVVVCVNKEGRVCLQGLGIHYK